MTEASLKIIFCSYNNNPYFIKFYLDGIEYHTFNSEIQLTIPFGDYEKSIGKKVCKYELIAKDEDFKFNGSFEIFLGKNIGYCFIDNVGTTFEIMFLLGKDIVESFTKSDFSSSVLDAGYSKVNIKLSLDRVETKDRANLILINCLPNTTIKKNGDIFIDLEKIKTDIDSFSTYNSYQICYYYNKFDDFSYKIIQPIEKLNFSDIYSNNHILVDNLYNDLMKAKDKKNLEQLKKFMSKYKENAFELEHIIKKKYIFSKDILEKELNKEDYVDFIFKIIFFIIIYNKLENYNNYVFDLISDYHEKLVSNKKSIENDKLLKIYEKIFLLIDIYYTELLDKNDYILHYYHEKNFEKFSPLYYAYEFLRKFINDLDYDSILYYPLLLIDGDKYQYKFIKDSYIRFITIYGYNMLSLEELKMHLIDMIPNIILISEYINDDNSSITNPLNGNVILNQSSLKNKNIQKKQLDEYTSKHDGFILSKNLIHEFFGHKKSSYSSNKINYDSIISFKNEDGDLKFISRDEYNMYIDKGLITALENVNYFIGDSGYFIEYFLGKIEDYNVLSLIDFIENKTNLSELLDTELWHKKNEIFKEYIKLKVIYVDLFPMERNEAYSNISDTIKFMKSTILKKLNEKNNDKDKNKTEDEINSLIKKTFKNSVQNLEKSQNSQYKSRKISTLKKNSKQTKSSLKSIIDYFILSILDIL